MNGSYRLGGYTAYNGAIPPLSTGALLLPELTPNMLVLVIAPGAPLTIATIQTFTDYFLGGGYILPTSPSGLQIGAFWKNGGVVSVVETVTSGLSDFSGFLALTAIGLYPTSSSGLVSGSLYAPSGGSSSYIYVVPGFVYSPSPPLLFGSVSASQLLVLGAEGFPQSDPNNAGQIWNDGRILAVSVGSGGGFANNDGFLALLSIGSYPTSSGGLLPGALYAPSGGSSSYIYVVPGFTYVPSTPVFFGSVTTSQLLALGATGLPQTDPGVTGQVWNDGNILAVSVG